MLTNRIHLINIEHKHKLKRPFSLRYTEVYISMLVSVCDALLLFVVRTKWICMLGVLQGL